MSTIFHAHDGALILRLSSQGQVMPGALQKACARGRVRGSLSENMTRRISLIQVDNSDIQMTRNKVLE